MRGALCADSRAFAANLVVNRLFVDLCAAQLVEQRIRNAKVGGSTPLSGTIYSQQ
ncbi:hypothetical protein K457DRAFT_26620 [Linnemannia elongata AG-77]|uniref:Uncharacterized protein n=1 Tax=Linnemannia elongata AG-77 TaxID=1314771 RepID=A0A197JA14_9FUNG|nr:hypothetical protein K457DRAFT_26620 [Linnemannia elongata AG-77]